MAGKESYEVTVLDRTEVKTYPKLNQPVTNVMVTYVAVGLPPYTITIPKDKWTPEAEKRQIKASIESRLKEKPQTYRV